MTPRRTIVGTLASLRIFRDNGWRRGIFTILIAICAVLTLYPERHRAAVLLTPTDPGSLGLGGALGQLGAINSVFGNQAAVEIALKVARGVNVREEVMSRLGLMNRLHFDDKIALHRWLERKVTIRTLRGGIVLIEMYNADSALARDIVGAYSEATRERLAEINRRQTEYKRDVLLKLVGEASDRLATAQATYDTFRLRTRYGDPAMAIEAIGDRIPALEAAIKKKEVDLAAARQFATDDNMMVRQIVAELQALRQQLAQAQATSPAQNNSVGRVVQTSTEAEKLLRELSIAKGLYNSYMRYLEGTSVEDLTSTASVRILEAPFVDTARQYNYAALAIGLVLLMLAAAIEFYRLRPPPGDRVMVREPHA